MRIAVLLALAALALPACADARLVPQRGMAGISLGMAPAKVRAVLGRPLAVTHRKNEFGPYTEYRYPFLLRVGFQGNGGVTSIETRGHRERTAGGIGVGSTREEVRRRIRGVRCEDAHCYLGSFLAGRRVTGFFLRDGRVTRIVVGFVID